MTNYRYADLVLSSSLALPELPAAGGGRAGEPAIVFEINPGPLPEPGPGGWVLFPVVAGREAPLAVARTDGGFVLRFPAAADFLISVDGHRVACSPHGDQAVETIRHLLIDQVLPRVIAHLGRMVIHAGAVGVDSATLAIVGASGLGKSTLVADFHNAGMPVHTDDGLIIGVDDTSCTCLALYPGLRLWPSSVKRLGVTSAGTLPMSGASTKCRVLLPATDAPQPRPLASAVILGPPPVDDDVRHVTLTRLSPRDACIELLRASFQLDIGNPRRAAGHLETAALVADRLPIYALSYPRDYSRLPEVREAILRSLQT